MADITRDLRTHLVNSTGVSSLIGARMYPDILPVDPTLPACTIESRGGDDYFGLMGHVDLVDPLVQIHCWANTCSVANQVYDAIRAKAINLSRTNVGDIYVNSCTVSDGGYRIDKEKADSDTFTIRYIRTLEVDIVHRGVDADLQTTIPATAFVQPVAQPTVTPIQPATVPAPGVVSTPDTTASFAFSFNAGFGNTSTVADTTAGYAPSFNPGFGPST